MGIDKDEYKFTRMQSCLDRYQPGLAVDVVIPCPKLVRYILATILQSCVQLLLQLRKHTPMELMIYQFI
ncbi:hypothetical protein HOLleu_04887 [Holothuria leucospilota]|uniref:Uncharacterized protein n=1 Tax=Holothuria leucospilota TaxID=206669 RepID=A0A9Q1CK72_HOLLE|nr:hypothetical protein HOLleu_04887 [Holothuria leucospilota]